MVNTETAYKKILSLVEPCLREHGVLVLEEMSHPQSFGSRCTVFGNGLEGIRLIWDGKESWFVLEQIPENSHTVPHGWADISSTIPNLHHEGEDAVEEIAMEFNKQLSAYFGDE